MTIYNYLYPIQSQERSAPIQGHRPQRLDVRPNPHAQPHHTQFDSHVEQINSGSDDENVEINQEDRDLLVYPPSNDIKDDRITIKLGDYRSLSRGTYLEDTIVDFYFKYLFENTPSEKKKKVFVFKTDIYQKLRIKGGADDIIGWKLVNLFEKDFVLIPICWNGHYSLFIIVR